MITIRSMHRARFAVFLAALGFSSLALAAGNNQIRDDKIKLKDHNRTAYTVYYDVTAAHCTDMTAGDIHLDPQIKNGGRN